MTGGNGVLCLVLFSVGIQHSSSHWMNVGNRQAMDKEIVCAWRLHPNTRNQAKGMLEVLRLAHVNSEFESRVSVRPSFRPVGRTLSKLQTFPPDTHTETRKCNFSLESLCATFGRGCRALFLFPLSPFVMVFLLNRK